MRQEIRATPGSVHSGVLRLVNESQPTRVRAQILDFYLDAEQTPQFLPQVASQEPYSCQKWLQINPMEAELQVMGELQIRYTIRVPASTQPRGYHCAAGFTSLPTAGNVKGIGMRSAVRIISAFYVIVGEPKVQGRLKNIAVEPTPNAKGVRAVILMENSGKIHYRPTGSVSVLDTAGQVLETMEIQPVAVLPERDQRLLFPLSKVTSGQPYKIQVKVDVGDGEIQEGNAVVQPE